MTTEELNKLKQENEILKKEISELKLHLKKYTAPSRNKTFYENHKEEIKKKAREYRKRTNYKPPKPTTEKRKEYSKRYYQKLKLKKLKLKQNKNI